jgi:hypothetical protein
MFDATRAESSDSARQAPPVLPVLRIFISSTAIDLTGYRDKVRDAVLPLENLPIAMQTFSALSGAPAAECMRMAAAADAVVRIVAHRYGYVPPVELGDRPWPIREDAADRGQGGSGRQYPGNRFDRCDERQFQRHRSRVHR